MDCPTEEALIRKQLSGLSGVVELEFRLMQRLLTVTHQPPPCLPYWPPCAAWVLPRKWPRLMRPPPPRTARQRRGGRWHLPAPPPLAAEIADWLQAPAWLAALLALAAILGSGIGTYKGLDCPAPCHPQYQCADEHRRHRRCCCANGRKPPW
jgi:Cd2+/Zn2+-exporting ATPase